MKKVYKHRISVVVFSKEPTLQASLGEDFDLTDVCEFIDTGDGIGDFKNEGSELVPPEKVHEEMVAIGNDGSFFDMGDDEDE